MSLDTQNLAPKRLRQRETDICRNGIEAEKDVFDSILFFWNYKDITEFLASNFNEINTIDADWTRRTCVYFAKRIKAIQAFCKYHENDVPVNKICSFFRLVLFNSLYEKLVGKIPQVLFRECRKNVAGKH